VIECDLLLVMSCRFRGGATAVQGWRPWCKLRCRSPEAVLPWVARAVVSGADVWPAHCLQQIWRQWYVWRLSLDESLMNMLSHTVYCIIRIMIP